MRRKQTHKTLGNGQDWAPRFLEALSECPNAKAAAKAAGVGRATAYERRETDKKFAKDWDAALKLGYESLHERAWDIAVNGVKEPVFYGGKIVGHVTRHNTALMIYLLRVHGPSEFRQVERGEPFIGAPPGPIELELPEILYTPRRMRGNE